MEKGIRLAQLLLTVHRIIDGPLNLNERRTVQYIVPRILFAILDLYSMICCLFRNMKGGDSLVDSGDQGGRVQIARNRGVR